jgi:hypothetical protein
MQCGEWSRRQRTVSGFKCGFRWTAHRTARLAPGTRTSPTASPAADAPSATRRESAARCNTQRLQGTAVQRTIVRQPAQWRQTTQTTETTCETDGPLCRSIANARSNSTHDPKHTARIGQHGPKPADSMVSTRRYSARWLEAKPGFHSVSGRSELQRREREPRHAAVGRVQQRPAQRRLGRAQQLLDGRILHRRTRSSPD